MNIFVLSTDPVEAAVMQLDRHIVKMPLESAQMLCAAYPDGEAPYKKTHYNHPSTVWARTCKENHDWLIEHGLALCIEYTNRYGRRHKCQDVIEWVRDNRPNLPVNGEMTPFVTAISADQQCRSFYNFDSLSTVTKYRLYYLYDKSYMGIWNRGKSNPPEWYSKLLPIIQDPDEYARNIKQTAWSNW